MPVLMQNEGMPQMRENSGHDSVDEPIAVVRGLANSVAAGALLWLVLLYFIYLLLW